MPVVVYVLIFSFVGSVLSLAGGVLLLLKKSISPAWRETLAAFAAGTLLGAAFIDLLPDAVARGGDVVHIALALPAGFVLFLLVERLVHGSTPLVIASDTLHNFLDGVVIGGTFVAGIPVGIATSLAVAAHEVPQEIGDFAILLHNGMRRGMVLLVNVISATVTIAGALATWYAGALLTRALPSFLALAAGMFLYIAAVDLIPHIRRRVATVVAFVIGIIAIAALA